MMTWLLTLLTCLVLARADSPSNCRLYLVGQYDWSGNTGFYLDFEGSTLQTLPVILGVADGQGWRFISHRPGFVTERDYSLRAVIAPDRARLFVDGALVAESPGGWQPASNQPLEVNVRPPWASDPGDWIGIVRAATVVVTRDGQEAERREYDFTQFAARPVPLMLFEPGMPTYDNLASRRGDTVEMDVTVQFASPDLRRWAPLIDRYEQCVYADWPGKVRSDDDLRADIAAEESELAQMAPPTDRDPFGGCTSLGWSEPPTGFFRVTKHNGKWWLITPAGNPCFYAGVCAPPAATWETTPVTGREFLYEWLPPRQGPFAGAWSANHWGVMDGTEYVCLHSCNLIRKYGEELWQERATQQAFRRLAAWGFCGAGKWGAPRGMVEAPVLGIGATPRLVDHPDVFDLAVRATFRAEIRRQVEPRRDDPLVIGWSLGNEYGELITPDEVRKVLAMPADVPAKRALVDHAVEVLHGGSVAATAEAWQVARADREALYAAAPVAPAADIEALRRFYQDRYWAFIYDAVKEVDPNHLYLGNWIVPRWWVNEEDWSILARHCDVIGYDRYSRQYDDDLVQRLQARTDKPTLIGEFSMPAWYDGLRGYGRYGSASARDDEESGELYYQWARAAAKDPYCVGMFWFFYRDQPLTGRGPGRGEQLTMGEHYAFGLITCQDRPKWDMVRRMREANLLLARWRAEN